MALILFDDSYHTARHQQKFYILCSFAQLSQNPSDNKCKLNEGIAFGTAFWHGIHTLCKLIVASPDQLCIRCVAHHLPLPAWWGCQG